MRWYYFYIKYELPSWIQKVGELSNQRNLLLPRVSGFDAWLWRGHLSSPAGPTRFLGLIHKCSRRKAQYFGEFRLFWVKSVYVYVPCSNGFRDTAISLSNSKTQKYWVSGLCPSSRILNTRNHNVSETGSVSIDRWEGETPTLLGPIERANLNH
jgi:hypothetical protein